MQPCDDRAFAIFQAGASDCASASLAALQSAKLALEATVYIVSETTVPMWARSLRMSKLATVEFRGVPSAIKPRLRL